MVAFTPIYGLPYMEGSDPPCFGPGTGCDNLESVFCDFMRIVETQLDENDLITGRTGTAIPMCQIQVTEGDTPIDMDANPTPYDTVVFDTDNMADFSGGTAGITPRRNGQYRIEFEALLGGDYTDFFVITDFIINITLPAAQSLLVPIAISQSLNGEPFGVRASTLWAFTDTTPTPRKIITSPQFSSPAGITILKATLSMFWHSDL